jgi:hypothetical protein
MVGFQPGERWPSIRPNSCGKSEAPGVTLLGSNTVNADDEALSRFATEGLSCLAHLGLCLERLLEVLRVNARFGGVRPSHRRSLANRYLNF